MTGMGSKRSFAEGARLTTEILLHQNKDGGTTSCMYGSKGSGKTTLLVTLAMNIGCINPFTNVLEYETVIWRGRFADYWNWMPRERVIIFMHRDDFDKATFKNDLLDNIPTDQLPPLRSYTSCKDLYEQIMKYGKSKINVVYEPTSYELTKDIMEMIQKRGVTGDKMFKDPHVDPVIFWFEFTNWLNKHKSLDFLSIIFDEADELFPQSPAGPRWHLNLWAKDVIKDFRKRNISMYLACHGVHDIDGRIIPKIQYRIYMKGCVTPTSSLVRRMAPIMLDRGIYFIEKDAWGLAKYSKIPEQPRILVEFLKPEELQEYRDHVAAVERERAGLPPLDASAQSSQETTQTTLDTEPVISERVSVDESGRIVEPDNPDAEAEQPSIQPDVKRGGIRRIRTGAQRPALVPTPAPTSAHSGDESYEEPEPAPSPPRARRVPITVNVKNRKQEQWDVLDELV